MESVDIVRMVWVGISFFALLASLLLSFVALRELRDSAKELANTENGTGERLLAKQNVGTARGLFAAHIGNIFINLCFTIAGILVLVLPSNVSTDSLIRSTLVPAVVIMGQVSIGFVQFTLLTTTLKMRKGRLDWSRYVLGIGEAVDQVRTQEDKDREKKRSRQDSSLAKVRQHQDQNLAKEREDEDDKTEAGTSPRTPLDHSE